MLVLIIYESTKYFISCKSIIIVEANVFFKAMDHEIFILLLHFLSLPLSQYRFIFWDILFFILMFDSWSFFLFLYSWEPFSYQLSYLCNSVNYLSLSLSSLLYGGILKHNQNTIAVGEYCIVHISAAKRV